MTSHFNTSQTIFISIYFTAVDFSVYSPKLEYMRNFEEQAKKLPEHCTSDVRFFFDINLFFPRLNWWDFFFADCSLSIASYRSDVSQDVDANKILRNIIKLYEIDDDSYDNEL